MLSFIKSLLFLLSIVACICGLIILVLFIEFKAEQAELETKLATYMQNVVADSNVFRNSPGGSNSSGVQKATAAIALTFDDGPDEATPALLDVLKKHNIKATFFLTGQNSDQKAGIARDIFIQGHTVGNHSFNHPLFLGTRLSSEMRTQIIEAQDSIAFATDCKPKLFRAPYGHVSIRLYNIAKAQGLYPVVWTHRIGDWEKDFSPQKLELKLSDEIIKSGKGAIPLLHDRMYKDQAYIDALDRSIQKLKDSGYIFITLDQLFNLQRCQ